MLQKKIAQMFLAVDQRDWALLPEFYCLDCEYFRPGFPQIQNREQLLHFYRHVRPIKSGQHELLCTVEQGAFVSVAGRFQGVTKSDAAIDLQFMDLYHFEQTRIRYRKTYFYTPLA
jgi:hypothetical protein